MKKLYRAVPVKDEDGVKGRLPDKIGYYTVKLDGWECHTILRYYPELKSCEGVKSGIIYWLEEIEMPSDESIEIHMKYSGILSKGFGANFYRLGMKFMRDLIFNNK